MVSATSIPYELPCSLYYGPTILVFGWSFMVGNEPAQAEPSVMICNAPGMCGHKLRVIICDFGPRRKVYVVSARYTTGRIGVS